MNTISVILQRLRAFECKITLITHIAKSIMVELDVFPEIFLPGEGVLTLVTHEDLGC